jgi:hypothetical protein
MNEALPVVKELAIANVTSGSKLFLQNQACAPGFGSMPGAGPSCTLCPPGYFSRGGLGSKCLVCDQFSYAVSSGTVSCTPCPSNQWVSFKGSASAICVCKKNFYMTFFKEASLSRQPPPTASDIFLTLSTFSSPSENLCLPCPEGANCLGSLEAPSPKIGKRCLVRSGCTHDNAFPAGFWANQSDPVSIVFCTWNKEACLGNFACLPRHSGTLCGRCEPNTFMRTGRCSQCSLSSRIIILYIILIGIFGGLLFLWLVKVQSTFVIISSVQYFQVLTILNR